MLTRCISFSCGRLMFFFFGGGGEGREGGETIEMKKYIFPNQYLLLTRDKLKRIKKKKHLTH